MGLRITIPQTTNICVKGAMSPYGIMETTLHRQLKSLYCQDESLQEVTVDGYRIDAIDGETLIEIQYGSLGAIRDKIRDLLQQHTVRVVKPLAARKYLITRSHRGGRVKSSRYSPTRETFLHLFSDLVHFVSVFPHPKLTVEVLLTEQEEHRIRRRKRRWKSKDYRVEDRMLREVQGRLELRTTADLIDMLPDNLPVPFSTSDLAEKADIPRWLAQKIAYCLRKTGGVIQVGKRKNTLLYQFVNEEQAAA